MGHGDGQQLTPGNFLLNSYAAKQGEGRKGQKKYTPARYRAWDKANKKRAENSRKITHGIVYKLTSPAGKAYVGISKYSIERRILWHKNSKSCCYAIKAALRKYGFANFVKEVLHSNVPLADLPALEVLEIAGHNTLAPHGYNLTKGGEYNPMEEEATRKKVAKAKKEYWERAGQAGRDAAARWMQKGDARARAATTNRERAEARWLATKAQIAAEEGEEQAERWWQGKMEKRRKCQEAYQRRKAAHQG